MRNDIAGSPGHKNEERKRREETDSDWHGRMTAEAVDLRKVSCVYLLLIPRRMRNAITTTKAAMTMRISLVMVMVGRSRRVPERF